MINKYNKGTSILEILVSVVIISIVMIFLTNLLIKVKGQDKDSQVKANYLINQSLFIKTINEDVLDIGISDVTSPCTEDYITLGVLRQDSSSKTFDKNNCVQIEYNNGDYGFLLFYQDIVDYYKDDNSDTKNLVRYTRGSFDKKTNSTENDPESFKEVLSLTKEYPDEATMGKITIKKKNDNLVNADLYNVYFPVIDNQDNAYNIDITYYKDNN